MECHTWGLERYARLTSQTASQVVGQDGWEHFDNKKDSLEMTLTSSYHLLIHHGKRQMESVLLTNAASWVKGVSKGDSLMVVMKAQNQSRRFRVKFSPTPEVTGEAMCRACVERLSKYFPVKLPENSIQGSCSQQVSSTPRSTPGNDKTLVGDVTIGQLSDTIFSGSSKLPELYARLGNGTEYDLGTLIKLCLTDPSFPAFVGQVEKELEKIKHQNS